MRIGFSLVDLAPGGAQVMMVQLIEELNKRDHQILFHLWSQRKRSFRNNDDLFNRVIQVAKYVNKPSDLRGCNVIQLDGYHGLKYKLPYLPFFKKCVETFHSLYSINRSKPILCNHRISVSAYVQSNLPTTSKVIPNGIILPVVNANTTKKFDLCILGRIHPVKGHLIFLQICEIVFRSRGELSVLMIGGYSNEENYRSIIEKKINDLQSSGMEILVTGWISHDKVNEWIQSSKILVITSQDEGFGRMAVEGMACCLPIVSNPVGGLLEIILDGETGFFAEKDDPGSFSQLVIRLLEDPDLSRQFGEQGRKRVLENFTLESMVTAYENYYYSVKNEW
jgi:glycosyltransferase involved in cell wall biosynthesis